jgi:hypothetical protein
MKEELEEAAAAVEEEKKIRNNVPMTEDKSGD